MADEAPAQAETNLPPAADTTPDASDDVDVSLQSILHRYSRWAEQTMDQTTVPELQRFLQNQRTSVFFREISTALLWVSNSAAAMRGVLSRAETTLDQSREETREAQERAEKAEEALKKAQAEMAQAHKARSDAEVALGEERTRVKKADSDIYLLKTRLHSSTIEIKAAEERAENAEEIARQADSEIKNLKVAVSEAEARAADAEKKATEAVANFKTSEAYETEMAESVAFAYDGGFQDCKAKVKRLYGLEGIEDLEMDGAEQHQGPGATEQEERDEAEPSS